MGHRETQVTQLYLPSGSGSGDYLKSAKLYNHRSKVSLLAHSQSRMCESVWRRGLPKKQNKKLWTFAKTWTLLCISDISPKAAPFDPVSHQRDRAHVSKCRCGAWMCKRRATCPVCWLRSVADLNGTSSSSHAVKRFYTALPSTADVTVSERSNFLKNGTDY